ncbi:sulfatase-like hydrolase/transferase [Halosquirtibacter laminarini]|uniref:Sulfatase-like hydrolase/transferase n=1 Tax=Halosquirtibacter laminarini TaxID=3374600 RepID=A0AC61NNG3_9BACT|nr:sulfatase-like hydrolase/transferase [Prolixibacteraceae bacterium]
MKMQTFAALGVFFAFSATASMASFKKATKRPNVLFILTDDQHREEFNFLKEGRNNDGSKKSLSPTIDRLANEGVIFNQQHVVGAICTPSRFSILTGRYPSTAQNIGFKRLLEKKKQANVTFNIGITNNDYNISKALNDAGYYTGGVGKNHVIQGDESRKHARHRIPKKGYKKQNEILENIYKDQIAVYKEVGFDYAASIYPGNLPGFLPKELLFHNTDWIVKGALDFLDMAEKEHGDEPFFLYFATTVSHGPAKYGTKYIGDRRASAKGWLDKPVDVLPSQESIKKRVQDAHVRKVSTDALWLDDAVNALVSKIEKMGELDNTIIVFLTDHGVEHGKFTCYEGGTKTASFYYGPKFFKGHRKLSVLTSNVDFAPTILDLCKVPLDRSAHINGKSIKPILDGKDVTIHDHLYHEVGATRAILKDHWKYIAFRKPQWVQNITHEQRVGLAKKGIDPNAPFTHTCDQPGGRGGESPAIKFYPNYYDADQLYNLSEDSTEQHNLAKDPTYVAKLKEMKALLAKEVKQLPGTFAEFTK